MFIDGVEQTKIHTSCSKPIGPGATFGDFVVERAVSKDNGVVCPVPDCLECKGGVIELTLRYNGAEAAQVRIESETVVFDQMVQPGEEFTIVGDRDDGKFKNDIKVFINDVEQQEIHTSCSQPIGPGALFGMFEVVAAISKDNGNVCPLPECQECKGGVVQLTLRYNGAAAAQVRIESETVVFDQMVQPGEEFTIFGDRDDGKFKNDIKVFINNVEQQEIHTSCSQPIAPGITFGDFEVVDAISKDNGRVCPAAGGGEDSCEIGKPQMLIMEYTVQNCAVTSHSQDPGKVSCVGDPAFAPTVAILAGDKENPDDADAGRFFDGLVDLNALFPIDATNDGENRLKSNT